MNKKLEGLRNDLLFKLNAIGDYNTHKEMWDTFYEYEKELRKHDVRSSACPCNELPDGEIAISSKALQKP